MIWNSLEEALDIILLWKIFPSLQKNPRVCLFFFFFLCLRGKCFDIPNKRFCLLFKQLQQEVIRQWRVTYCRLFSICMFSNGVMWSSPIHNIFEEMCEVQHTALWSVIRNVSVWVIMWQTEDLVTLPFAVHLFDLRCVPFPLPLPHVLSMSFLGAVISISSCITCQR